jgi:pyruvate dehydrogenase E2 component (dihydrolipoamide acetyltransferase)
LEKKTMAISVVMPALEMAQETGKLLAWRKKEGDNIVKGEPLLEIETDKATVEVEATADGVLAGIKSHEGDVVAVGTVIAWILQPGEVLPMQAASTTPGAPSTRASAATTQSASSEAAKAKVAEGGGGDSVKLSPKARRLAKEHHVDLSQIRGTGPYGSITVEDILAAKDAARTPPATATFPFTPSAAQALSTIARIMAERTTQSWTTVPHFFIVRDSDAGALLEYQRKSKTKSASVSVTDCLVVLVARTLERHPVLNSNWNGDSVHANPDINISIAIAVDDGVIAPVIHMANTAKLADIAVQRVGLAERARSGKAQPADLAGGTFTISNLGMFKVDSFTAIITPPQAAVLAVGAVSDRVVARNGKPAVRPIMTLTLSSDHRVVDGARAAAFLNDLVEAIQEPAKWLHS